METFFDSLIFMEGMVDIPKAISHHPPKVNSPGLRAYSEGDSTQGGLANLCWAGMGALLCPLTSMMH